MLTGKVCFHERPYMVCVNELELIVFCCLGHCCPRDGLMKNQELYLTRVNIIGCKSHLQMFTYVFRHGQWTGWFPDNWTIFKLCQIILYFESRLFLKEHSQMFVRRYHFFCIISKHKSFYL